MIGAPGKSACWPRDQTVNCRFNVCQRLRPRASLMPQDIWSIRGWKHQLLPSLRWFLTTILPHYNVPEYTSCYCLHLGELDPPPPCSLLQLFWTWPCNRDQPADLQLPRLHSASRCFKFSDCAGAMVVNRRSITCSGPLSGLVELNWWAVPFSPGIRKTADYLHRLAFVFAALSYADPEQEKSSVVCRRFHKSMRQKGWLIVKT